MKEFENFFRATDIEITYHNEIFEIGGFEKVYTKIDLTKYKKIRNQIYWLSLLIYRISFVNYIKSINRDINIEKNSINLKKENLLIFHPVTNITSEICKQFKNNYIYPSYISMLGRQIIEQICLIEEIWNQKIDDKAIFEAAIESHNIQLGCKSLNIDSLNTSNKGILKVFSDKKSYGKMANKYNYGFMYKFFSGDIHILSQIDKLIPFSLKNDNDYCEIYLNCILTLLRDYLLEINEYNTEVKIELKDLERIKFINIKGNDKI